MDQRGCAKEKEGFLGRKSMAVEMEEKRKGGREEKERKEGEREGERREGTSQPAFYLGRPYFTLLFCRVRFRYNELS